ncbi:MAG: phosphoglycerate kinase [bacterium]
MSAERPGSSSGKLSVRRLDVQGKRVFVRVDFNVPFARDGSIASDARIRASLPTLNLLLDRGATAVIASHLGKPKGKPNPKLSLRPVADRLAKLLGRKVLFASNCIGPETEMFVAAAPPGSAILLENLRFHVGEEANEPAFADALAALADRYVNDAFGTAHRTHASTVGVPGRFERPAAGLLMEKEIDYLSRVIGDPERPFVAVIGGAKVSDKAAVIGNLLASVDHLLVGGGLMFSFLLAQGRGIGRSLRETDLVETAGRLAADPKLVLPADVVVTHSLDDTAAARVVPAGAIPETSIGVDIGPATARIYADAITRARTVVWAGPMGVFERDAYARGSEAVARAIASATEAGATTVVGGGDTLACLAKWDLLGKVSHASTGGGACLEFLEGRKLPGIEALARAD